MGIITWELLVLENTKMLYLINLSLYHADHLKLYILLTSII